MDGGRRRCCTRWPPLIRAERWHRILEITHIHSSRADCYGLTCVGYMGNNVLPARAGEVLRVVLMDQRATTDDGGKAGKRTLLGTIVAERDHGPDRAGRHDPGRGLRRAPREGRAARRASRSYVAAAGAVLLVVIGLVVLKVMNDRGQLTQLRDLARPLAGAPRALWGTAGIPLLAATVLLWGVEGSVYLAVAKAVGLDISATGALYLVGLTNFVAALPAAPGSIGTFDAAVAFGARVLGGSGGLVVSYVLLLRFILYIPITVVGLVVLVTPLRRLGAPARHHPPPADEQRLVPMACWPQRPGLRRPGAAPSADGPCSARPRPAAGRRGMAIRWVLLVCLALSALTLLFPSTPTYDPWAWLLWGREILHLDLVTDGGPSWKPLPVMFNVPFSIFGVEAAPYLWLWIARAGALLALAMSFRLARRLVGRGAAGVVAGVFAAAFLLTTYQYVRDSALGNSEALLAALFLWAFERHLDGRRDHALYLGLACALLRPEVWPFLGLYGLWLFVREPRAAAQGRAGRPGHPAAVVRPGAVGLGRALPGLEPCRQAQPRQRRVRRPPGARGGQAVRRAGRDPAAGRRLRGRHRGRAGLGAPPCPGRDPGPGRDRHRLDPAGGRDDRARLRRQPALPDRDHRRAVRARRDRHRPDLRRHPRWRWPAAPARAPGLRVALGVFAVGLLALSPVIKAKVENVDKTLDKLRYEASLWHTLPGVIDDGGRPEQAAGLRQRLQRPVPDPDGGLPAGRARHQRRRRAAAQGVARARA